MASESKAIEKVVQAAQKDERNKIAVKARAAYVAGLEKTKRVAQNRIRELENSPNISQLTIGAIGGAVGGMGGFKAQKYLAGTTAAKAVNEKGEATFGAKTIRTGVPVGVGLVMAIGGAFVNNGPLSAALMGGGAGIAGGALTSALLDT
jgi:hypothetical protein